MSDYRVHLRKLRHESRISCDLAGIADVIGGAADD